MNLESWKQRARLLSAQTYALYLAYRHPRTPWYAKIFAALIVGYVFSPIDPIPDFIPGVGLLDEMVVVPIGILIAAKMIPHDAFAPPNRDDFADCRDSSIATLLTYDICRDAVPTHTKARPGNLSPRASKSCAPGCAPLP